MAIIKQSICCKNYQLGNSNSESSYSGVGGDYGEVLTEKDVQISSYRKDNKDAMYIVCTALKNGFSLDKWSSNEVRKFGCTCKKFSCDILKFYQSETKTVGKLYIYLCDDKKWRVNLYVWPKIDYINIKNAITLDAAQVNRDNKNEIPDVSDEEKRNITKMLYEDQKEHTIKYPKDQFAAMYIMEKNYDSKIGSLSSKDIIGKFEYYIQYYYKFSTSKDLFDAIVPSFRYPEEGNYNTLSNKITSKDYKVTDEIILDDAVEQYKKRHKIKNKDIKVRRIRYTNVISSISNKIDNKNNYFIEENCLFIVFDNKKIVKFTYGNTCWHIVTSS